MQTLTRDVPVTPGQTALLFIDVQNYAAHPKGGEFRDLRAQERAEYDYYLDRLEQIALRDVQHLQAARRTAGIEVIYAVIENLTADDRDRSLDYKISGIDVAKGSWDAQVCDAIAPGKDEIVLRKNSSNVFISTNIDYLLRCLEKRQLIVCSVVTDQCVESAVRDACDLGYLVTLVPDACATYTQERHDAALSAIKGCCRQRSTAALVAEVAAVQ